MRVINAICLVPPVFFIFTSCGVVDGEYSNAKGEVLKNTTDLNQFNVVEYNDRRKIDENYQGFITDDGAIVEQFGDPVNGYVENRTPKSGYFTKYRKYFPDGSLNIFGEAYAFGQFKKGVWVEYDEEGTLLSEEDFDTPFTFRFEDVLDYAKANAIDLKGQGTTLHRWVDEEDGPVWSLSWNSGDLQGDFFVIRNIKINGLSGEVTEGQDSQWLDN